MRDSKLWDEFLEDKKSEGIEDADRDLRTQIVMSTDGRVSVTTFSLGKGKECHEELVHNLYLSIGKTVTLMTRLLPEKSKDIDDIMGTIVGGRWTEESLEKFEDMCWDLEMELESPRKNALLGDG